MVLVAVLVDAALASHYHHLRSIPTSPPSLPRLNDDQPFDIDSNGDPISSHAAVPLFPGAYGLAAQANLTIFRSDLSFSPCKLPISAPCMIKYKVVFDR